MTYQSKDAINLEKIINLIKQGKISDALIEFENYLKNLSIGTYSEVEWPQIWRQKVYEFGELFNEINNNHAGPFIEKINKQMESGESQDTDEAIQFIHSEMIWNYFPLEESYSANILKNLTKKYPCNPEFHHSYSHFFENKGNYDLSIEESCLAFKIERNNNIFYETCFNKCKNYFNALLLRGKTGEAEKIIKKMESIVENKKDAVFNNIIVSLHDRVSDHKIINERIGGIEGLVSALLEKERGKTIEIMGFFVAILGFVFININLATNSLPLKEVLLIMIGMGIILSFFATLVSILFRRKPENFYKDLRFWLITILILMFITFVWRYQI